MFAIIYEGQIEGLVLSTNAGDDLEDRIIHEMTEDEIELSQSGKKLAWNGTAITVDLEFLRSSKFAAVNALYEEKKQEGYIVTSGALTGEALQTRDAEDDTNWLVAKDKCRDEIIAGNGAVVGMVFRTLSNTDIPVSYTEGLSVINDLRDFGLLLMAASWAIKNEIDDAADEAELDAIDITEGWP